MVARASGGPDGKDVLPDPQLHTHAFVVKLIQTEDAEWKAHHNDALYRDQLEPGRFYRAELAANLERLGYAVEVTDDR
jgi:conjugative relaxase-like TrwC/TraI family protein